MSVALSFTCSCPLPEEDPQRVADWAGLSLRAAVKHLTPAPKTPAPVRKSNRTTKSGPRATGLDIAATWNAAALAERTRALDNIGLRPLLEAFPQDWISPLERWLTDRRKPAALPSARIETAPDGFPELPAILQRSPVTTH